MAGAGDDDGGGIAVVVVDDDESPALSFWHCWNDSVVSIVTHGCSGCSHFHSDLRVVVTPTKLVAVVVEMLQYVRSHGTHDAVSVRVVSLHWWGLHLWWSYCHTKRGGSNYYCHHQYCAITRHTYPVLPPLGHDLS